ncbi:MAG: manganese-binding transcriptional regulator MntR [Verrucomicrobia bacterium]|nr:manganese-binding transcriptional regulator MntR [Verrucomicrobiota bacterium]
MKPGTHQARRRTPGSATAARHRKTRRDNASEVAEDYVEAIAGLLQAHGEARGVDLARHFGVSPVTVIHTIARLKKSGLVRNEPYRAIFLTDKGRQLAIHCQKRHELVSAFLCALGVPAPVADQDAEGIEHHVSAETLAAFKSWMERHAAGVEANHR